MTPEDIRKCKKNGYVWVSDDETPYQIRRDSGGTRWKAVLRQINKPCMHATRAAAQAAIDERKRLARIAEYRKSMEPITPDQAKDLRIVDRYFVGTDIAADALHFGDDGVDKSYINKGLAYWTREAAEAALANRETPFDSSRKWIERKIGDIIQVGDEVTDWKDGERIIAGKSIAGLPVKSSMTARYVNPLWVALQEAKKTPSQKAKKVDCFAAKPSGEPASRITAEEQQPKISYDDAMRYARQNHRLRQVGVPEYYRIPFGCRDILDVVIDLDHPLATAIEHLYRCRHKTSDDKARDVHKAINILERWLDAGTLKTPCPF